MDDKKIDEMYASLLKTADNIAENGITEENVKAFEKISEEVDKAGSVDEETAPVESTDTSNQEGTRVMVNYDANTGEIVPDDNTAGKIKDITEYQWNSFHNDSKDIDMDLLKNILGKEEYKNAEEAIQIATLVKRWKNGERFNPYNQFPDSLKAAVDGMLAQVSNGGSYNIKDSKNFIAKSILDQLTKDYVKASDPIMDLDTLLAGFDEDLEKTKNDMSKELGSMMMSLDQQRRSEIDAAIERCKAEGKEDSIAKFEAMKENLDSAFNLDKFAEFCKTVRIKKFDLEKPSRPIDQFNSKYIKHKYNINNIAECPVILERHGFSREDALKFVIAFCKYCINMNPDNIDEHTFMYYTIRNIIAMDRVNPKGKLYEAMDDSTKAFYDGMKESISKCINNLKRD